MQNPIEKLSNRTLLLLLSGMTLALYAQTLSFDFTYDDIARIEKNSLITNPIITLETIFKPLFRPTFPGNLYRPITEFSFRLDFLLAEKSPVIFHLTNIILHTLNVILCFILITPFSKNKSAPFFAATLFALAPINIEAVGNICGRYELMAALWAMISCIIFYEGIKSKKLLLRHLKLLAAALIFAFSCLSKESGYTFLAIIPLYSYFLKKSELRNITRGAFYLLVSACITLLLRYQILKVGFVESRYKEVYESTNPLFIENFLSRIFPGLQILGQYIFNIIQPISLAADHSANYELYWKGVFSSQGYFHFSVLLVFLILIFIFRKETYAVFSLWFICAFSLTSNILIPIGTIMGDRLAYAPSIGLIAFLVLLVSDKLKIFYQLAFFVFLTGFFINTSISRIPIWQNNETLFRQMVVDRPDSPNAHLYYGGVLIKNKNHEEAEYHLRQAHALRGPLEYQAAQRLTKLFYLQGQFARSEYFLREVLKIAPNQLEAKKMLKEMQKLKEPKQQIELTDE